MTTLIADIGATNARFAMADGKGGYSDVRVYACANYRHFADAVTHYCVESGTKPDRAVVSIASPVDGSDVVRMTNHVWEFSISQTVAAFGWQDMRVVNDFTAVALAVPHLQEGRDFYAVGGGVRVAKAPIAIIGPGTGLGVAGIAFDAAGQPSIISSEGGHVTVPVQTAREFAVVDWLLNNKYSHVSAERVASGKGLLNLYTALCALDGLAVKYDDPAIIMREALAGSDHQSVEAVDLFCHWLGSVAGNLALSYGAFGGVYIAGGIVPQMGDAFAGSRFRDSFLAKGRYRDYLDRIATVVITHPQPGLLGLAAL